MVLSKPRCPRRKKLLTKQIKYLVLLCLIAARDVATTNVSTLKVATNVVIKLHISFTISFYRTLSMTIFNVIIANDDTHATSLYVQYIEAFFTGKHFRLLSYQRVKIRNFKGLLLLCKVETLSDRQWLYLYFTP